MYIAPLRPKTQRRFEDREVNQARSKPDTVNRPVRTARIFVHHYNSTQYCNTDSFYLYSHSSRPTSHLRCGHVEVKGVTEAQSKDIFVAIISCYESDTRHSRLDLPSLLSSSTSAVSTLQINRKITSYITYHLLLLNQSINL